MHLGQDSSFAVLFLPFSLLAILYDPDLAASLVLSCPKTDLPRAGTLVTRRSTVQAHACTQVPVTGGMSTGSTDAGNSQITLHCRSTTSDA